MGELGCRKNDFRAIFSYAGFDVGSFFFFFFYFSFEMGGGENVDVVFDGDEDGVLFGEERERGRKGVSLWFFFFFRF